MIYEEENNIDPDIFEEELNRKIESYFSSNNNELLSYEKIDDFLKSIDLYQFWNSEEEKDVLWQSLMKYNKDKKVDKDGAIKGFHDLLTQEDTSPNSNSKEENLLTRISRMSIRNDGTGTVNRLALNKYIQKAKDEFDCLDNETLIQFMKIFALLNFNENRNNISVEKIEEICNKHKFITLDQNDIIKYLSYLTCESKPVEEIKTIRINMDIFYEIDTLLQEKIGDEVYEDFEEDEEGGKKDDPLDILEDILQGIETTKDNTVVLKDMKNNLLKLNENMTETAIKILQEIEDVNQHENISNIESFEQTFNEKMAKIDDFIDNLNKDQKSNIKTVHKLKKSIISVNNDMNKLKDDYKLIYEKYNSQQDLDLDEEMERLLDENVALNQELNMKKGEIADLLNERADRDKIINDLNVQKDEHEEIEKDLRRQISELKNINERQKEDFDKNWDDFVKQIEEKQKEEIKERNRIKEMIETQLKNEEEKNNNDNNSVFDLQIRELSNIDQLNIPLTEKLLRKKKVLDQLSKDQLMQYLLKVERLGISLKSEKNKNIEKIRELEDKINQANKALRDKNKQIGSLNADVKKYQSKITSLKNDVKSNEIFRPSIKMNGLNRISRLSKLNMAGINEMKFGAGFKNNKKKTDNSFEYFGGTKFNVSGKKNIHTAKLREKNINSEFTKGQNTKFIAQAIHNEVYGEIKEEQNEEEVIKAPNDKPEEGKDNIQNENKNEIKTNNVNNNFEISKNSEENIMGNKVPFTNLEKNGIEINIQQVANNMGDNQFIAIDSINDINLGGEKDINAINRDINLYSSKIDFSQDNNFFDSKPADNFEIIGKKEESARKALYDDDDDENRDTIHINNGDENMGGFGEMLIGTLESSPDNLFNTGRESDNNARTNQLQVSKYGFNTENKASNKENTKHNDKLKSSDNLAFNSLEKLNRLDIKNDNNINIEGKEKILIIDNFNNEIDNKNEIIISGDNIKKDEKKDGEKKGDEKKEDEKKEDEKKEDEKKEDEKKEDEKKGEEKKNDVKKEDEKKEVDRKKKDNNIFKIDNSNYSIINNDKENKENKENKKNDDLIIKSNDNINIINEEDKKEDAKNEIIITNNTKRKRTIIDVPSHKLKIEKVLEISGEKKESDDEENHTRKKRINSTKALNDSKNAAIKKKMALMEQKKAANNNYDYYSLFQEDFVKNKLRELKDTSKENDIYSDEIYILTQKKKLEKQLILLTPSNVCFIERKNSRFLNTFKKEEIKNVGISNANLNILVFMKNKGDNVLIITIRRMDLLYYIRDHYRKERPFGFKYQDEFTITIKNNPTSLSVKDKIFTTLSNFDGALKIGYLLKLGHFVKIFSQKIVVLTSIGLIVFDDPAKPPERLYPIINSKIEKVPFEKYKRENCFEITTISGETKVFAAYKERELKSWLDEFKRVQNDFKNQMTQLDTTQKNEFMENKMEHKSQLSNVMEEENEDDLGLNK